MTSVTFAIPDEIKSEMKELPWVNWSELVKEESMKRLIFEKYIQTGKVSDEDWKFCEKIDWHPVDELPLKEEYIKKIKKITKEKHLKLDSISDIFK